MFFLCLEAPKAHLQWYRVLKCHRKETDPRLRVSFERLGQLGIERRTAGYNANGTCIRQKVKLFWHSKVFLVPGINFNFHAFLSSADFLKFFFFRKRLSGIPSECHTVWIQIRSAILSGLL